LWFLPALIILVLLLAQRPVVRESSNYINPFYGFAKRREGVRRSGCQNNIQSIALALKQYQQDFAGKYPLNTVGGTGVPGWSWIPSERVGRLTKAYKGAPVGWADALQPHVGSEAVYLCPSAVRKSRGPQSQRGYTDYWFNGNAAGVSQKSVASPSLTLLLGDGNDGADNTNATYNKTDFSWWISDTRSPMYRHLGGANYLFVDGHVQWLKPDAVKKFGGRADPFSIK
jgi:prepilin-type processing-associated H-X9-DG protein